LYFGPSKIGFWTLYFGCSIFGLEPITKSGRSPLKEASKKVSLRKNESKKALHATPSRRHIGASSPSFFCHLSTSHLKVFETWAQATFAT